MTPLNFCPFWVDSMAPHTERIYWVLPVAMFLAGLSSGGMVKWLASILLWIAAGGSSFYWLRMDAWVRGQSISAVLKTAMVVPLLNVLALGVYLVRTRRGERIRALAALIGFTMYAVASHASGWYVAKRWLI
jgi:hypothetical protein